MVKLVEDKCCARCWHDIDRPCPDLVACVLQGPLCHDNPACAAGRRERMAAYRRETLERPAIFVGAGTCGLGAGAGKTLVAIRKYLETRQVAADVVEVGCIGLCVAEPMVDIQLPGRTRLSFRSITESKVEGLLDAVLAGQVPTNLLIGQYRGELKRGEGVSSSRPAGILPADRGAANSAERQAAPPQQGDTREGRMPSPRMGETPMPLQQPWPGVPYLDEHPFFAPQTRWVLANCGRIDPARIEESLAHGGYQSFTSAIRRMTPGELCGLVEASGLRGRGGGGFMTGKKWKFALATPADQKYLICNADEGDPGAFMDRAVIEGDPHRVLEGMAIAAYAIGATKAVVYIRAEYPPAIRRLQAAIAQAKGCGLLGANILGSGFNLDISIKMGAGAFVCGEETALIHSIEGRRGMPRPRPPFPAVQGLFGRPTVINNVETLANLPLILANGPEWFASVGTAGSKGTKVFALSGKVVRTGLVEVAMGTTMRRILFDIGGGVPGGKAFKAAQIGGPSGGCIPARHLDVGVDYESLSGLGAIMGSGGLVVMDEDTCMVDVAKFFMDFIQRESCGKCIPCREGTRRMLEILQRLTRNRSAEHGTDALERFKGVMYLNRLAEVIKDTSLCGLGQTAPNPVLSTLRWFRDEYEAHIYERRCPAGACVELRTYAIDEAKCKGCTLCAKKCPSRAIVGSPKSVHHVVAERCVGCGACAEVCKFGAVTRK